MQVHEQDLEHEDHEMRQNTIRVVLFLQKCIDHCVVVHCLVRILGQVCVQFRNVACQPRNIVQLNFDCS